MGKVGGKGRTGRLFVVATPIGHLGDITLRALEVLKNVDLIAAEKVSRTRKLLSHHCISGRVIGYRESDRVRQGTFIVSELLAGRDVALVSDAGTPGLSDPGADLAARAHDAGIAVIPVPGASAVAAAVSVAGFEGPGFVFAGFLPAKAGARKRFLRRMAGIESPLVFFEAPHRLEAGLRDMLEVFEDRPAVLIREMTKVHETVSRKMLSEHLDLALGAETRGEVTIVVAGAAKGAGAENGSVDDQAILAALAQAGELSPGRRASLVAGVLGVPRRRVYDLIKDPGA